MRKETQNFIGNIMLASANSGLNLRAIQTQKGDLVVFRKHGEQNVHAVLVMPNKKTNVSLSSVELYHADLMKDFK